MYGPRCAAKTPRKEADADDLSKGAPDSVAADGCGKARGAADTKRLNTC
jgi:hypothetical protein